MDVVALQDALWPVPATYTADGPVPTTCPQPFWNSRLRVPWLSPFNKFRRSHLDVSSLDAFAHATS